MQEEVLQAIREIRLFSTMSDDHLGELVQNAILMQFPANVELVSEGDPADFLHILIGGTVEMYGSSQDRQATMFLLRSHSTFNLSAALENAVYLLSARTLSESSILMISGEDLRNIMEEDTAFAYAMVMELTERYRTVIKCFKDSRLRSGVERLANYLISAHEQHRDVNVVELTEDKRKLAALLGMTPEYLSRAFTKLKKYGVEVHGSKITLKNLDALDYFAKPNPLIDNCLL